MWFLNQNMGGLWLLCWYIFMMGYIKNRTEVIFGEVRKLEGIRNEHSWSMIDMLFITTCCPSGGSNPKNRTHWYSLGIIISICLKIMNQGHLPVPKLEFLPIWSTSHPEIPVEYFNICQPQNQRNTCNDATSTIILGKVWYLTKMNCGCPGDDFTC